MKPAEPMLAKRITDRIAARPARHRGTLLNRWTTSVLDLVVMVLAFGLSYLLRFDFRLSFDQLQHALAHLPVALAVQFAALYMSGALAFVWKYVGMSEVPRPSMKSSSSSGFE